MSRPLARAMDGVVLERRQLTEHLVRIVLAVPGFETTGIPDEWLALTVPGQFQTRYYTVRSHEAERITLDIVVHDEGLVTNWAQTDCVGDQVGISVPKGSYQPPDDAGWVVLVGDLTALAAMARIGEVERRPVTALIEAPAETRDGYPDFPAVDATWLTPPAPGESALAAVVRDLSWPDGPGYFWMAGESAQMRDVRKHTRQVLKLDSKHTDAMGYWSGARGRQARAVDPGPIYERGRREGKTDEQIWADYDRARGMP